MPAGVLTELAKAPTPPSEMRTSSVPCLLPDGVVAIPPDVFGHLPPLFIRAVPGVIFTGVPPYSLWEHPPTIGRIPRMAAMRAPS